MKPELLTYLHDHLAGATFALELLDQLSQQQVVSAAATLAKELIPEIKADRAVLEEMVKIAGEAPSSVKELASWIIEKASRFKLDLTTQAGVFEALEFLCLGVLGKAALWDMLAQIKCHMPVSLDTLRSRARSQHRALESTRLTLGGALFAGPDRKTRHLRSLNSPRRPGAAAAVKE